MNRRSLGNSGLRVSEVGLGGNTFGDTVDGDDALRVIQAALDLDVTFIDTAESYSEGRSEELIGRAVAGRRPSVVIASKVGWFRGPKAPAGHLSRRWIMQAVEGSLRRLSTNYIDLYQAHLPDPLTPLDETLRAMDDLVHQGKVRYIGCSNYAAWELVRALGISQEAGLIPWNTVQSQWNLVEGLSDPTLLPACRALGIGIIPYRPLAAGILTGKYERGAEPAAGTRIAEVPYERRRFTDANLAAVERIGPWAEARRHTTAELAIAWLLAHPEVPTVIVGARTAEQVAQNVRAAGWTLTPEEMGEVVSLAKGQSYSSLATT